MNGLGRWLGWPLQVWLRPGLSEQLQGFRLPLSYSASCVFLLVRSGTRKYLLARRAILPQHPSARQGPHGVGVFSSTCAMAFSASCLRRIISFRSSP